VQTIVALAHNLNMHVVAEGVEKAEQQTQLQALECEYGQGFYFSNPVEGEAAGRLFLAHQLRQTSEPSKSPPT
jgi:EAL domain-containing protein (putative c-di-GMP-specific phosphodiesterase class I)